MTRGKHGAAAQAKADAKAIEQIRALEANLATEREAHRQTKIELQAVRDRGAGDLIAIKRDAATTAIQIVQAELDAALAEIEERKVGFRLIGGALDRLANRLEGVLRSEGLTEVEAYESVMHLAKYMVHGDYYIDVSDLIATKGSHAQHGVSRGRREVVKGGPEEAAVKRLQVARGLRHAGPIPQVD